MLVVGGQTAGGSKNPVVFPAGRRTGAGSALGRIRTTNGPWTSILADSPSKPGEV